MSGIVHKVEQAENRLAEAMWTRLMEYQRHDQNINDLFFSGSNNLINSATLAARINENDVARLIGGREKFIQNSFLKFARRIVLEIPKQNCMDTSENGITSLRLEMVFARMAGMTSNSGLQCEPMTRDNIEKIIKEAQSRPDNGPNGPCYQNFHIFVINCWNKFGWKLIDPPKSLETAINAFLNCKSERESRKEQLLKKLWPVIHLWLMPLEEFNELRGEPQIEVLPWDECVERLKEEVEYYKGSGTPEAAKADVIDSCLDGFWSRQH